jgi:Zinc finger, C2H2 type
MDAFKCGHCGRRFGSPEELQQHEKECVPARVK